MNQHYFSASPAGDARLREIEVTLAGSARSVVTAGGVFSPDQLDRGTAVLLRTLEQDNRKTAAPAANVPAGAILDLGCGWGPIALSAALEQPDREIVAVDVNERSRELTRENASRLGLSNIRVAAPEQVSPSTIFSEIRSNPPIRVGKQALHVILRTWLPRVEPGGRASLVVAKHLGADSLQRWIAAEFSSMSVSRVARDKGFHVIEGVALSGSSISPE